MCYKCFFVYRRRVPLVDCLPTASADCIDLISKLLHFNPDKRLSAMQSLRHHYVAMYVYNSLIIMMCVCVYVCRFHNPKDEPELSYSVVPYLDDNTQLSLEDYRDTLYEVSHLI